MKLKTIGITMRCAPAKDYAEERDALARDWHSFMKNTVPECRWIMLPNLGLGSVEYAKFWRIEAMILSGGNDIGVSPQRDLSENALLDFALSEKIPIFGVCRGLEVIQHFFKGSIAHCDRNFHVNKRHPVRVVSNIGGALFDGMELEVNSYHGFGVPSEKLVSELEPWALSPDGFVEGAWSPSRLIMAVQWHPEREKNINKADRFLIRRHLGLNP